MPLSRGAWRVVSAILGVLFTCLSLSRDQVAGALILSTFTPYTRCTRSTHTVTMPGISDLLDTDMEEPTNFIDENSIISSASEADSVVPATKKGRQTQG